MTELYKQLLECIMTHKCTISVSRKYSVDDIDSVIQSIRDEHPEIFWFVGNYSLGRSRNTVDLSYRLSHSEIEERKGRISKVIQDSFVPSNTKAFSQAEKAMYVYKWITNNCEKGFGRTIEAVLLNKASGVEGISRTAKYLLDLINVESMLVNGTIQDSSNNDRRQWSWLVVKIDGKWYHYDVAYDFNTPELDYKYFCVSTNTIRSSHLYAKSSNLPDCNMSIDASLLREMSVPKMVHSDKQVDSGSIVMKSEPIAKTGSKILNITLGQRITISDVNHCINMQTDSDGPDVFDEPGIFHKSLFARHKTKKDEATASVYAPCDIKRGGIMMIQAFVHRKSDGSLVAEMAEEADLHATRRGYAPIKGKVAYGDRIDLDLSVCSDHILYHDVKSVIWTGDIEKACFIFPVSGDIDALQLYCNINMSVKGLPVGQFTFITDVVESPTHKKIEVLPSMYKNVFISYAHGDYEKVKWIAQGYKAAGINYFFDRHNLQGGDVFDDVIRNHINLSDLFVLCWTVNSSKSEYVRKEIDMALLRTNPRNIGGDGYIKIYPLSMSPKASYPDDLGSRYNFVEID